MALAPVDVGVTGKDIGGRLRSQVIGVGQRHFVVVLIRYGPNNIVLVRMLTRVWMDEGVTAENKEHKNREKRSRRMNSPRQKQHEMNRP